jgi:hypothetical protein
MLCKFWLERKHVRPIRRPCKGPFHNLAFVCVQEYTAAFAVTSGTTLELTLAQFWSSLGPASLAAELAFHGVQATPAKVSCSKIGQTQRFGLLKPVMKAGCMQLLQLASSAHACRAALYS